MDVDGVSVATVMVNGAIQPSSRTYPVTVRPFIPWCTASKATASRAPTSRASHFFATADCSRKCFR